jgi:uncharacterized membrane protein
MMNDHPEDFEQWEGTSQIDEARRRRRKHGFNLPTKGDRAALMSEIAGRLVANADYFIFSLLSAGVLVVAILSDAPAIYILAALLAPFMAPVVGLGFATVVGSPRFFIQSLGSFLIGSLFMFAGGAVAGWISKLLPNPTFGQIQYHSKLTLADFLLLTIGILLAIYITVKLPKSRSLVASVALAYELYLPIGVAGFALTGKVQGVFLSSLETVGLYLAWMIFIGTIFLAILKIKPYTFFGYFLTAIILAGAAYILLSNSAIGSTLRRQVSMAPATPTATSTAAITNTPELVMSFTATPTLTPQPGAVSTIAEPSQEQTLLPTETPTATIAAQATPVYALVYSSTPDATGVIIRKSPGGEYMRMLEVNTLVEIIETQIVNNTTWVHIRIVETNEDAWISQSLLQTATPSPDW